VFDQHKLEFEWLRSVADCVRGCGVRQPVTIGTMYGDNIDVFAPLCDVLCGHAYAQDPDGLSRLIESFAGKAARHGKSFLVNESIPGALDDEVRAEAARFHAEMLSAAGFGWMGWALREGKAVSTRRDRYDYNGINGEGFHPFFTREGRLRGGLQFLTEPPALRAPWERTADDFAKADI